MVGRVPAAVRSSVLAVLVGIPLFALAGWQRGVFWHCAGVIALTALVAWQQARLAHRTKLQHRAETESGRTRDALLALHRTLELYAQQDGLTGLANRRQFDQVLHEEWQRARHTGSPLALILLDLDYLQPYNAEYGYLAGDDCMRAIAHAIRETKIRRPGDLAARYDGAHLAILLANTERDAACALAEQIRHAVCALRIMHPGNPAGVVTLSAGVAACVPAALEPSHPIDDAPPGSSQRGGAAPFTAALSGTPANALRRAAEAALRLAKTEGRNRVRAADALLPTL